MTKSFSFGNDARQDELSNLVAKEVGRILSQCDEIIKAHSSAPSRMATCNLVAADLPLATRQQAIHYDLSELASEFVHRLATRTRQFDAGSSAAALSVAQAEYEHRCTVPKAQDQQLGSVRIEDWAGQVAGPTYLERHFGIPRSTLHWWQRHNDVIALRKGARKHVFPLDQFIDGRPAPGIRQVLSFIPNPRLAWDWLTRPSALLGGRVPVEMLRHDLTEDVILAALDFSSIKPN
ncbi:antitoxin Xre/MbcA/ParS toxin-binding domain-containing protein [Mesorhizobium sp. CO1-1-8]|uniref:antitoxin Xre/MbcA/ParS-like domain-containing protein n=1 Tax=Mesorhizobium sp. CO1-1-8 TaxID=2876631 RepID=UPI001CD05A88|nr:antitoxin Xre/MbcA/ParS toxin-binding domain-containing protein [Mesorhizobium sp. CO1-1-8]MBZ9772177.1 DUF2384 domain-containing protein [Mesorhizobium sp. CO1-1-8]